MPQQNDALLDMDILGKNTKMEESTIMDNSKQKEQLKLDIRRKLEDILDEKRLQKQLEEDNDLD